MNLLSHKNLSRIITFVAIAALSVGGGYLGSRLGDQTTVVYTNSGDTAPAATANHVAFTDAPANDMALAFQMRSREVAASTLPTVVELNVVSTVTQTGPASPFEFFFGPQQKSEPRQYQQQGLGSGVIVGRSRDTVYVLTNNHVVGDADEIEVVLFDGRSYTGQLVGSDDLMDLALVSFETDEDIPVATLGDSDSLVTGDWVFAVGNPLGFQSTVTAGIVSAIERSAQPGSGMSGVTSYIQTDAAINRGNSGGALVNIDGDVVGINTWIASQSGGNIGLGFAIPVNMAKRAINDFINNGEVSYSWLGVLTGSADDTTAAELGIEDLDGAFVFSVYTDSPAAAAGIQPGDLITTIGDDEIHDPNSLVRAVAAAPPNESLTIRVIRNEKEETLTVRTSRRESDAGNDASTLWPGVIVTSLSDNLREEIKIPASVNGVIVAGVTPGTGAEGSGIRQGDVISAINGTTIASVEDFYRTLSEMRNDEVQFRIQRGAQTLILGFVHPTA